MMSSPSLKLRWGFLTFAILNSLISPAAGAAFNKRDAADLLQGLLAQLNGVIPNVTQEAKDLYDGLLGNLVSTPYTIPQDATVAGRTLRKLSLFLVRTNFVYGPPVAGGPAFPTGLLGIAKNAADSVSLQLDVIPQAERAVEDLAKATVDSPKFNGLETLDDYVRLYEDEWLNSFPNGPEPGVLTNYTQDLFFSMQRLSNSPYKVKRLIPGSDTLPFLVENVTSTAICGRTVHQLFREGRLFYADYRDQEGLAPMEGRYAGKSDVYFYIDPETSDFLPLAIRTNVGANLIYTPLDGPGEWLLAKMMVNVNDFWFAQWNHLAFTHETVHIIWMATIRSLSSEHPVFAVLNRLTFQVFSIQIIAQAILFTPGLAVDLIFPYTGQSAMNYSTEQYENGGGNFQANYFLTNLERRGLINSTAGPPLKHFPFYEDASIIHASLRKFFKTFINSYYPSDSAVALDTEIQSWVAECNGPAEVFDFPRTIKTRATLIDVLTQLAYLVSPAHHTVNTNSLLTISSVLPFSPPALYRPLPTSKNSSLNPVEWLPPLDKALEQIVIGALFARPSLVGTKRSLIHMFDDEVMLGRMNGEVRRAEGVFAGEMRDMSRKLKARGFDTGGLSGGSPFLWRALDPGVVPYNVAT